MAEKREKKQGRSRVLILGLAIIAFLAILLWQMRGQESGLVWLKQKIVQLRTILESPKSVAPIVDPLQVEQKIETPPARDEVIVLNDRGVDLVLKKQYWQGIFLFKQAMDLDPSRIEPVMNMAVTLDEVGLSRPAARYLAMAETMTPDYPPLQRELQNRKSKMQGGSFRPSPDFPNDQKR